MNCKVVVEIGPARAGKSYHLLARYRATLCPGGQGPAAIGRSLWIAPTARAATAVREQLLAGGIEACLSPGVVTFDQLTDAIRTEGRSRLRPLSACQERELLRRVVHQAIERDELAYFARAARGSGFIDLLVDHLRELKRREIDAVAFAAASDLRGDAAGHRELGLIYAEYQRLLAEHGLVDREGRHWVARDLLAGGAGGSLAGLKLVVADGFTDFTPTQHDILQELSARSDAVFISLPGEKSMAGATGTASAADDSGGTGGKHWQSQWHTSERSDLFAKTATTLAELQRRHGGLKVCMRPQRTSSWPALEFLSAHLFRNPRHVPPAGDDVSQSLERLEIVAAAGAHDEIVEIARRIKRRLVSTGGDAPAARPGDIVVVFRSLPAAAPRVREVFASYGIPFSIEARERLLGAPVIRTLLAVLHLADEDWLFRRVVSVLTNNSLTALADAARRAAERLVRDLQINKGRAPLLDRAEQLAQTPQALEELPEHQARRVADAREALSALRRLADALDRLPEAATHAEWCQALPRLGAELGLSPFVREAGGGAGSSSGPLNAPCGGESVESASDFVDRTAWQKIVEHFTALARLDDQLRERPGLNGDSRTQPHGPPPRLSRKEMLQLLVDVAGHESLPRRQDDVGRVRILSAATARTITAKHLFLAGMSEQAFPSPEPPGRLYREADYRTIQRNKDRQTSKRTAGVDEPPDVRRTHEEMLLFYELLTRAEETLTLSYPSLDDKAQQLPPSPYVEEIKRLLGAEKFDSRRSKPRLSPLPPDGPPWSANEWRLQATSRLLAGEPEQLGNLLGHSPTQAVAGAIAAGLRIVAARSGRQEFGWAEGLMNSPAIAARLARRFGPQHDWSPSQFEEYAACPYKFFLHQVLGLEPLGELSLEIDYLRRGSRVHQVLAEFHSRFADNPDAWAELQRDVKRFTAELMRAIDATLGEAPRDGLDAALLELDRRQIEKWASAYQAEYEKYQGRWPEVQPQLLPRYFELRFGPLRKGEAGPEDKDSKGEYFRLDVGGERIKIVGRIDRIDVGGPASRPVFNVIDYKSGHRPKLNRERIESGESMQPALYVMAAEALVFGAGRAMPLWAGYWSLKDGVSTDKRSSLICSADGVTPSDDWLALRQKVSERVGQIVRDVRQGMFPVHNRDEQCTSRCEFRTVCRIGQVRATGKIWPPDTECGELQDDNL